VENNNINKKDEQLYHIHRWLCFSEMLAEQSARWLSAEEGNKRMMEKALRRRKKKLRVEN